MRRTDQNIACVLHKRDCSEALNLQKQLEGSLRDLTDYRLLTLLSQSQWKIWFDPLNSKELWNHIKIKSKNGSEKLCVMGSPRDATWNWVPTELA